MVFQTKIMNEHLICSLCMGYLRDAMTVTGEACFVGSRGWSLLVCVLPVSRVTSHLHASLSLHH